MINTYCSLHNHTDYSNSALGFSDSINRVPTLIQRAYDIGLSGVAITDHECISSFVKALKYHDKMVKDREFSLILGNEIYLLTKDEYEANINGATKIPQYHFILIALDTEGYHQLCKLSTRAWLRAYVDGVWRRPTLYEDLEEIVKPNQGHIVASSACFTRGHLVKIEHGVKPIEEIVSGDRVLSSDGKFHTVITPTQRSYCDKGNVISFQKNIAPITCTKDHKFLVLQNHQLIWKDAQNLNTQDLCVEPVINRQYNNCCYFEVSSFLEKYRKERQTTHGVVESHIHKVYDNIKITPELMRTIGYWLADGHCRCNKNGQNSIGFTINEEEFDNYKEWLFQGMSSFVDFDPYVNKRSKNHRVDISYNSKELAIVFKKWFGNTGALYKHIPSFLKNVSKELNAELLYGYLLGDGHFRYRQRYGGEIVCASISKDLIFDIAELFLEQGFSPSYKIIPPKIDKNGVNHQTSYYLSVSCQSMPKEINKTLKISHEKLVDTFLRYGFSDDKFVQINDQWYATKKIKSNQSIEINDNVFCLNVETTHNFVCNNVTVHNCLGSRIDKLLLSNKDNEALNEVERFQDIFGKNNFFLEVQPSKDANCDQSEVNKKMLRLSQTAGVPLIATTDAHYLKKEDKLIHKVFLNSQDGEREVDDFYATAYMMTPEDLRNHLHHEFTDDYIDEMFKNTELIRKRVTSYDIWHDPIIPQLPKEKIPEFTIQHYFKDYYEEFPKFGYYATLGESHMIQERYFFYQCEEGLYNKIYKNPQKQGQLKEYIARLDTEWNELYKISGALHTSMVCYYSTMTKLIDIMWDVGSIVGCGRGSSAGFLTCYILGINQVDPVPFGDYLPYWRHVALERGAETSDIDTDSEPCKKYAIIQGVKNYFGEDRVLNVATFSTLSAKTAIERACRGLGLSDDISGYIKSLIPVNRGKITSLDECLYGNKKNGTKPITEIVNEINKYPNLKECALGMCGLICQRGLHPAGLVIGNEPYTNHLAAMRAPNKTLCTCYSLEDAEAVSLIKFDLLTIDAVQKIHRAMDAMLNDGVIQWQGSLRATYDKYLHPDVIDYTTPEMWKSITKMFSCFQWETPIGVKALSQVNPKSLMDLSAANSLIRLMPEGRDETPLETYVRYDKDPVAWDKDATAYGLTQEEKDVVSYYCKDAHYLADCQEKIMRLSMDKRVSGYTLKEANLLRKAIAKKDAKLQEQAKAQFFEYGKKLGTREIFLDYVWNVLFSASFGYSFSALHSTVYSIIALQEVNLYYHYNPVYWNVGCLSSEATPDEEGSGGNTDYGKLAKAVYKMRKYGVEVNAPDINQSGNDFTPIAKENRIVFGLSAISGINPTIASQIISNRPYTSFVDFYSRNTFKGSLITPSKIKQLIKAGCFDCFNPDRVAVMKEYICLTTPISTNVSGTDLRQISSSRVSIPRELSAPYNWLKYVCNKQFLYGTHPNFKTKKLYWLDERAKRYFDNNIESSLEESVDYWQEDDRIIVVDKSLEKVLKPSIEALKEFVNTPKFIDAYNKAKRKQAYEEFIDGVENVNLWSFDSCSYFSREHVLAHVDYKKYNLSNYQNLPEEPEFVERTVRGRSWKQYQLSAICGIVLSRTDPHHIVTILTPENEVVNVKFNQGAFAWYKQQFSEVTNGKKTVLDKSWFNRGVMIIVSGYRRGDEFVAKKYKNSIYQHQVALIESIDENNELTIRSERYGRTDETDNSY